MVILIFLKAAGALGHTQIRDLRFPQPSDFKSWEPDDPDLIKKAS